MNTIYADMTEGIDQKLMQKAGLNTDYRRATVAALERQAKCQKPSAAIELQDGTLITARRRETLRTRSGRDR